MFAFRLAIEPAAAAEAARNAREHHQHCLQEHRDVFEAIRSRNPQQAYEAVRILLERANDDVNVVLHPSMRSEAE